MLLPCQYCPGTDNVVQEGLALWATNKNTFIVVMRFVVCFFFLFWSCMWFVSVFVPLVEQQHCWASSTLVWAESLVVVVVAIK